jgi:hypothetical protein
MAVPNRPPSQSKYTSQYIDNTSFDEDFGVAAREQLVYDPTAGALIKAYPASPLNLKPFDYASRSLAGDNVTETWTFKSGGSGGTTTNTVVIVYTDSTLATISTVTKT